MRTVPALATMLFLAMPVSTTAQEGPPPRPDPAQMLKGETDDLALVLDLKPAQRPALEAFLKASRPPERPHGPPPGDRQDGTPPRDGFEQHLARMEAETSRHAEQDHGRIAAARAFYAGLDAHQRDLFEAVMRLRHGPGGPGPHGGPGGPEGPGGPPPGRG